MKTHACHEGFLTPFMFYMICKLLNKNIVFIRPSSDGRHFASIFVGVMPLCDLRILEIHSFPHFSLTCFDILS